LDNHFFIRRYLTETDDSEPLRAELFSAEQMAQFGKTLALSHKLAGTRSRDRLLSRLADNEDVLISVCRLLTQAVNVNHRITPAAEWLLDNFHLIEEQIRTAKRHLPQGYSRELPCLAQTPHTHSACLPRVYDIALQAIVHGDARLDADSLTRFVTAYQSVTVLKLGELWAIPIMLRLALIENIRRMAIRIAAGMADRDLANTWADQMIGIAESDPKNLILIIADMARSQPPMSTPFVSEFARRLQGHSAALALPLTWIERMLAESNQTIEQLVQIETQKQASSQVYISNSIASLHFLSAMNWRDFVENMSAVEHVLRQDIAGLYSTMDFATRDRYRHVVEITARLTTLTEQQIAEHAIRLALEANQKNEMANTNPQQSNEATAHVGYYLVDRGLAQLERAVAAKIPRLKKWRRAITDKPILLYLGVITLITSIAGGTLLWVTWLGETGLNLSTSLEAWSLYLQYAMGLAAAMLVIIWASQIGVGITNWLASLLVTPHLLPRMDYEHGIPAASRTLVIVPCMLTSRAAITELLAALEVRFLANRDPHLHIGLLTDFTDAAAETEPADDLRLAQVVEGVTLLNDQYSEGAHDRFFLFHRPRRWNQEERIWMGFERKRGKIADLNGLLKNIAVGATAESTAFSRIVGETAALTDVKYVITLDADTRLPRDAAKQFAATIAHPLNAARQTIENRADQALPTLNQQCGYAILQPRVAISMPMASRSRYARLFGSQTGIDPYTRAVSDVYQDAFGEGSFIGKGIYDVDAFESSLDGRFPPNRILSHDLLEGCYARAALVSDLHLYEEFPARYRDDMSRRHRWIRGDWQIASWLLRRVPSVMPGTTTRQVVRNPLSMLSQWKIFDNLRRSLVPTATMLLLLVGWLLLNAPSVLPWTLLVIGLPLVQPLAAALAALLQKPKEVSFKQHVSIVAGAAIEQLLQALFAVAMMPFEAYSNLDAIVRTNWRIFLSRRNLLQWTPSVSNEAVKANVSARHDEHSLSAHYRWMWFSPLLSLTLAGAVLFFAPSPPWVSIPILLLWVGAPAIAWWVSQPMSRPARAAELSTTQIDFLRHQTRKTWAFFLSFVNEQDNWLPPDNVQEHPVTNRTIVAHRTSPTNLGLALLANLSAYDFGYISGGQLLIRTQNTLTSMARLARYEGHFYNWYDTQTLKPMAPLYVSTVDSGNLVGHLLTLRVGLLQLPHHKIVSARLCEGLVDTLSVMNEYIATDTPTSNATASVINKLQAALAAICEASDNRLAPLMQTYCSLRQLAATARQLLPPPDIAITRMENVIWMLPPQVHFDRWAILFERQCQDALTELAQLAPWVLHDIAASCPTAEDDDSNANANASANAPSYSTAGTHHQLHKMLATMLAPTLYELAQDESYQYRFSVEAMTQALPDMTMSEREWIQDLQPQLISARQIARQRMVEIEQLSAQIIDFSTMSYDFLYDNQRHLFSIGYNVGERRQDASFYDMLASEARLCTFVGIAQGLIPQESWFRLGRLLAPTNGAPALLSWSGSMFEYLMPLLIMPSFDDTLLDDTYDAVVAEQIAYGAQRGVAWGISESGYNLTDASLNYQYRAFGVPGLGLKRGLADDLVVTPYASALALMVAPQVACANLVRLAGEGLSGAYGFYEAVDYTAVRLLRGQTSVVIRSFMAHHQGMILLSLASALLKRPMQARFQAEPMFQATMLLLQERVPKAGVLPIGSRFTFDTVSNSSPETPARIIIRHDSVVPEVQLLSNGRYHLMLTNAGGGSSRYKDIAVTR